MNRQLQIEQIRDRLNQFMEMPVSDSMVERVALYHTALCAIRGVYERAEQPEQAKAASVMPEPPQPVQSATGAWRSVVYGKDMQAVSDVMDRHFEVISAIAPKHYAAVLAALDKI